MAYKSISAVVPVYNSQDSLEPLSKRLSAVLETRFEDWEIILINDGSRDGSWAAICKLADANPHVRGVNLMRNYGQHNALLAGIRMAKYELTVTLDDDLQHPPEEIPKLLETLNQGYDVVYGSPKEGRHGFSRNIASQITKLALYSVMSVQIAPKVSAFRVFRTSLRNAFADYHAPHPSIDVLLSWATTHFSFVEVAHEGRKIGKSNYTFLKLLGHSLTMATGYSTLPLRFASILGFTFTLFGFFVLVYVLSRYMINGSPVAGFPFLASTVSIFAGVQLFCIGIIGEYLARMYSRMMDKPTYVIEEIRQA
ncbi:MAG: glycosyltransferase family 2 protein [Planctomycetales bacterium]|nr:glycosyltransferase family 2 protein [Planctomycetales bacterium]